jgi:hypothetical protein
MARFSERIGLTPPSTSIQVESMSIELHNSLWNLLHSLYEGDREYWLRVAPHVAQFFRKVPVDELPQYDFQNREWLKEYFYSLPWYGVYDLVEFIVHNHRNTTTTESHGFSNSHRVDTNRFIEAVNRILEQELSAYRFVQGTLTRISNKEEVEAIESAVAAAQKSELGGAALHIRSSIQLLGKKPVPDYRNAIKEAISAVESVAKQIVGVESATLDSALKELSEKSNVHGALRAGFSKLYGYTSDEGGIRHAILDEPNVGFAEAKYMIVSCSAFVHYLIQKSESAGLLKKR